MRLPHVESAAGLDVAIVGVPYDGGTSYRPGARLGPREIRAQSSLIRPYSYFQKVAPFDRRRSASRSATTWSTSASGRWWTPARGRS